MTDKMKCPFCGMELQTRKLLTGMADYVCINNQCGFSYTPLPAKWWQALIDGKAAQDALKVAIDRLNYISSGESAEWEDETVTAKKALEKIASITTRENKE